MAFTKSQRLFMLNTYFECKNYAAITRRFHAEFNIHIDRTTICRTIKKFREDSNLTARCASQRSKLSTDVTNQIVRFFIRNPRMSLRKAAAVLRLSREKIPKNFEKFKIQTVQTTKRAIFICNRSGIQVFLAIQFTNQQCINFELKNAFKVGIFNMKRRCDFVNAITLKILNATEN